MIETREAWLQAGIDAMRKRFADIGKPLPEKLYVSVGFPSVRALARKRRIGECWTRGGADKVPHILISPVLGNGVDVLDTLAHELVHVVEPLAGHGRDFTKTARAIGLTTGPAASQAAGADLRKELERLNEALGGYPHSAIDAKTLQRDKQSTRMLKVECPSCGYVARVSRKWLVDAGAPLCPVHSETQMEVAA